MEPRYVPPDDLQILPFDTGAREPCFLAESGDRRWQINGGTADLLMALRGGGSLDVAAAELAVRWDRPVDSHQLAEHLEQALVPLGIVRREGAEAAASGRKAGGALSYLSVRMTLIPAGLLSRFSHPVRWLVHPRFFWLAFLGTMACGTWATYIHLRALDTVSLLMLMLSPGAILLAMGSTFVHELGHAAACRRFGCRHGNLGAGLYLIFPVLYMEVDETWRLARGERAIVAAAGMYFQFLFGFVLLLAAALHPPFAPAAVGGFTLIVLALITNLNPLFRFDGYWLASDLLGIPNLRRKSTDLLRALVTRRPAADVLPGGVSRARLVALAVYSVASLAFFVFFFGRLLLVLPTFAVERYPALMAQKGAEFLAAVDAYAFGRALATILAMVPPTTMLIGAPVILTLLAVRLLRRAKLPFAPARGA